MLAGIRDTGMNRRSPAFEKLTAQHETDTKGHPNARCSEGRTGKLWKLGEHVISKGEGFLGQTQLHLGRDVTKGSTF